MKIFTTPDAGVLDWALHRMGLPVVTTGHDRALIVTNNLRALNPYLRLMAEPNARFVEGSVSRRDFIASLQKYETKHPEWAGKFAHVAQQPFLTMCYGWAWDHNKRETKVWDPTSLILEQWAPEGLGPDGRFIECSHVLNHERERVWLTNHAPERTNWRCVPRITLSRETYTSVAGVIPEKGHRWRPEVVYATLAGAFVMMHLPDQLEMHAAFSHSRFVVERWSEQRIADAALEQHKALAAARWSQDRALEVLSDFLA